MCCKQTMQWWNTASTCRDLGKHFDLKTSNLPPKLLFLDSIVRMSVFSSVLDKNSLNYCLLQLLLHNNGKRWSWSTTIVLFVLHAGSWLQCGKFYMFCAGGPPCRIVLVCCRCRISYFFYLLEIQSESFVFGAEIRKIYSQSKVLRSRHCS